MKTVYRFTDYVLLTWAHMYVAKTHNKYYGEGRSKRIYNALNNYISYRE